MSKWMYDCIVIGWMYRSFDVRSLKKYLENRELGKFVELRLVPYKMLIFQIKVLVAY